MKTIFTIFCLIFIFSCVSAQDINQSTQSIKVIFNDSAAIYVLKDPANALKERDFIWNNFDGYRITLVWHKESSVPVTWKFWEKCLDRFINKDTSLTGKTLELSNNLIALEKKEHEKIVQHLSTYLPKNTSFTAYIYLIAFTIPYAFCVEKNKIGMDVTGDEWYYNPECILNTTIHEIYHVGYRTFSPDVKYLSDDPTNRETFIRFNYAYLLSEGMATYVAYKALDLFPTDYKQDDYKLLENDSKVKNAIGQINEMLEQTKALTIDSLNKVAWDVGVAKRAYYIAGAYMLKKIEEKFGREYLVELIQKGGQQVVKKYNTLVSEEYRITLVE